MVGWKVSPRNIPLTWDLLSKDSSNRPTNFNGRTSKKQINQSQCLNYQLNCTGYLE